MKYYSSTQWLSVTKAFYRWKKTEDFKRWRRKQFLKQGGLCYYYGEFLPLTRINVDHKRSRSKGGSNNKDNLILCCSSCNKNKSAGILAKSELEQLRDQNRGLRGTYLKNKQYFDNLYREYSDEALYEKLKSML